MNLEPSDARRRHLVFSMLGSAMLAACGGGHGDEAVAPAKPLDQAARAAVADGLVGAAFGHVTVDTAHSAVAVAGRRRIDAATLLTADDIFTIGSNTKAMTAMVVAGVVEQGRIDWNTRLSDALPGLKATMRAGYAAVTLEQLLMHRGGVLAFTDGDEGLPFLASPEATGTPFGASLQTRRLQFATWLLRQTPPDGVVPGRDFLYSNAGYALAATMVEVVTGHPFETLFAQRLALLPGMGGAWRMLSEVPTALPPTQPVGHEGPKGALQPWLADAELLQAEPWLRVLAPAGNWACTPAQYAAWLRWHLRALRGEGTPLPEGYVQRLQRLQPGDYAVGWVGGRLDGRTVLVHTGHDDGFMAEVLLDPAGRHAAFGLCNAGDVDSNLNSWVLSLLERELMAVYG